MLSVFVKIVVKDIVLIDVVQGHFFVELTAQSLKLNVFDWVEEDLN